MSIEKDELFHDLYQEYAAQSFSRAIPAMLDAAGREVDRHKYEGTDAFWEALSYDCWDDPSIAITEHIKRAVYHGDAEELGTLLLDALNKYLLNAVYTEIQDDWEEYV